MQKQQNELQNDKDYEFGDVELNQNGRPKQQVIFFELTKEMKEEAVEKLNKDQSEMSQEKYEKALNEGQKVWDKFYKFHKCNFFKDRTYLEKEMPQITLFRQIFQQFGKKSNYYQLGCGVGNTLFPLLRQFDFFDYYGCDISKKAIELVEEEVKKHQEMKDKNIKVCVCDLAKQEIPYQQLGDLNSLIFVLSAIVPEKHQQVMAKVSDSMKPGSFLFFRDYGRYDFGQLNLSGKGNRKVRQNFYMKNDGVCVYYFDEEQLQNLCTKVGLVKIRINFCCKMLQNRKKGLKMYRVWIQGRFYKPPLNPLFEKTLLEEKQQQQIEKKKKEIEKNKEKKEQEYVQKKQ